MATQEEMLQDIAERVKNLPAAGDITTEKRVKEIVEGALSGLLESEEFKRKMKFGSDGDHRLLGSKFSRWGLKVEDIEYLYDMQIGLQEANPHRWHGPSEELTNAFKDISEAFYLPMDKVREIDKKAIDNVFPRVPLRNFTTQDRRLARQGKYDEMDAYQRAIRAMDTAESGYGSQLIGAQYVADLWEGARAQSRIFDLIQPFEMTAPTAYIPVDADIPEMIFVSESTSASASNYATSKTGSNRVQVDAKKLLIHQMWSMEMEEDSIIPFVSLLREQVVKALAHYTDSLVLNGDTTNAATGNINLDDADPADTKHYLALDGIRHIGLVDATGQQNDLAGANIDFNTLSDERSKLLDTTYLMDWGHPTDPADLLYVADPETADRIARLNELINWKIQQGSTLIGLPGQVGEILGHSVISSIAMSKTEADGKVSTTSGNNTLGQIVLFNRRGFKVGHRRRVKMMMQPLPASDQMRMVHSLRLGFGRFSPTGAAAGIKTASVIFNIGL